MTSFCRKDGEDKEVLNSNDSYCTYKSRICSTQKRYVQFYIFQGLKYTYPFNEEEVSFETAADYNSWGNHPYNDFVFDRRIVEVKASTNILDAGANLSRHNPFLDEVDDDLSQALKNLIEYWYEKYDEDYIFGVNIGVRFF